MCHSPLRASFIFQVKNNPFIPQGGNVSAGRRFHQVEDDIKQDRSNRAFDLVRSDVNMVLVILCSVSPHPKDASPGSHTFILQIKEGTRLRAKMSQADREKRKLALLEPMWQDFERLHMPITSVLPSRIDRWGIEYDARWLP